MKQIIYAIGVFATLVFACDALAVDQYSGSAAGKSAGTQVNQGMRVGAAAGKNIGSQVNQVPQVGSAAGQNAGTRANQDIRGK